MSNTNPDAPVRIEVAMPRSLYDRLTDHDEAPRSRYDAATGRAEYVAEPGISHEWRAAGITGLFAQIALALEQAGRSVELLPAGATRLLSDDGAFEPDSCLFVGAAAVRAAARLEGYLDTRKGHPAPDLVVEVDRSVDSTRKLEPYFRMGVREAWTWSRGDGARIRVAGPDGAGAFRASERSVVLPGTGRGDLDGLLGARSAAEASRRSRALARQVARTVTKST